MKNFREPELGLLVKDVAFYRKYLQQHDRQVSHLILRPHHVVGRLAEPLLFGCHFALDARE